MRLCHFLSLAVLSPPLTAQEPQAPEDLEPSIQDGAHFGSHVDVQGDLALVSAPVTLTGTNPALAGLTVYHAFLAVHPSGELTFGSEAEPVTLVP